MGPLTGTNRCVRRSTSPFVIMAAGLTLAIAPGFAHALNPETIRATYSQAGNTVDVTLVVYNYSTPSDLQVLSQAYKQGQDRELAIALSKTKAVGRCVIAGGAGYDVAFIQVLLTPTGRQIIFVTSRSHPFDESDPPAASQSLDLAIGQFDVNDTDPAKSTGFLFPASKLVVDELGAFHYDLTGIPWALVNVQDSNGRPPATEPRVADAISLELGKNYSPPSGH